MKLLRFGVFLVAIIFVVAADDNEGTTVTTDGSSTNSTTVTESSSVSTTITASKTTTSETTTPKPIPETTTPKPTPETTTPKPTPETTTPKSTPETTTPKPTPETTTPKPTPETTTPKPTPETTTPKTTPTTPPSTTPIPVTTPLPPTPEEGNWTVTDGNKTCIRANLKILFKIPINGQDVYVPLSPDASSTGSTCDGFNGTQSLELQGTNYALSMTFEKNSGVVLLSNITFTYNLPKQQEVVYNDEHRFSVKEGNSYLCLSGFDIAMTSNVTMEVKEIHIQAFGAYEKDFGEEEECEADNPVSDVVPIAVGVVLLALVIIVLVAYLVGRRRNRQRGYQSV